MNCVHDIQEHIVSNDKFPLKKVKIRKRLLGTKLYQDLRVKCVVQFHKDFVLNLLFDTKEKKCIKICK